MNTDNQASDTTINQPANVSSVNALVPVPHTAYDTLPAHARRHPLVDLQENAQLALCEKTTKDRFDAIVPTLKRLANLQREDDFTAQAQALASKELGTEFPVKLLDNAWIDGLDIRTLYAGCIFSVLQNLVAQFAENLCSQTEDTVDVKNFFLNYGYHGVDITSCSDGRLGGLSKYILRLPLSAIAIHNAYAGALFDVEANIRRWESVELSRFRVAEAIFADAQTRYLKIVAYHYSSSDPAHQGCATHDSNDKASVEAGLARLYELRRAIENTIYCGAFIDILLIGVDTDTDSIRVHVPDSNGEVTVHRFIDNAKLYHDTLNLSASQARIAVYDAIDKSSETTGLSKGVSRPREGMRKLIVNLLINNLSQIEYVGDLYEGRYPDIGHSERYISVGDSFQEIQLRNIAYYAHLHTVEEGAASLDIGIKIFSGLNIAHGLPVPIAIHYRYDSKVPGSRQRMIKRCLRVKAAILNRYKDLAMQNDTICQMSLQNLSPGSALEIIDEKST